MGSHHYVENLINKKIKKICQLTELFPLIKDPHFEVVLLRSCLSLPKIVLLLAMAMVGLGSS